MKRTSDTENEKSSKRAKGDSSTEAAASILRNSSYFTGVSESMISAILPHTAVRTLSDGEVVLHERKPVEKLILIAEGRLKRTRHSENGDHSILVDSLEEGSLSGLLHLLKPGTPDEAYATITSDGASTVFEVPRDHLLRVLTSFPADQLTILGNLSLELRRASKAMRVHGLIDTPGNVKPFRILCFDSAPWVRNGFPAAVKKVNESSPRPLELQHTADLLSETTAANAFGYDAVCVFVNDDLSAPVLKKLSSGGVRVVLLRCAGFDKLDRSAASALGMTVARVPAYSPHAVAEFAISLLMTLSRKIHHAVLKVRRADFSLDGLVGSNVHGKKVAVLGTGKIGVCLCNILLGFGVDLVCFDKFPSEDLKKRGVVYKELDDIWPEADIIFLMLPLLDSTRHIFNESVLPKLKHGVIVINTARGALVDTNALITGLRDGVVGGAGLDVYENEGKYFFRDCSNVPIADEQLSTLLGMNNVILTGHQAFCSKEAISGIVDTTLENVTNYLDGKEGSSHPNNVL